MNSGDDPKANIEKACRLVTKACEQGAKWILLPEMFSYMGPYHRLWETSYQGADDFPQSLKDICKTYGVHLFAGSVGERTNPPVENPLHHYQKVYNTMFAFAPSGSCLAKYQKAHLFHLEGGDGQPLYSEAEGFCEGHQLVSTDIGGWHIAFGICYDIRFPEMFYKLSKSRPIDLLIVPAAFTEATGKRHWQLLLQARAVELQCFVLAANQTGFHSKDKECFGHSMIINPWGEVLENTGKSEGVVCSDVSLSALKTFRKKLPVLANRRDDLYP